MSDEAPDARVQPPAVSPLADGQGASTLREALAALEHDQWMAWSQSLASSELLSTDRLRRWSNLWVPYEELTEEQKDADRAWADKVMAMLYTRSEEAYDLMPFARVALLDA